LIDRENKARANKEARREALVEKHTAVKEVNKAKKKVLASEIDSIGFEMPVSVAHPDVYQFITSHEGSVGAMRVQIIGFIEKKGGSKTRVINTNSEEVTVKTIPWTLDEEIPSSESWRGVSDWWSQSFYSNMIWYAESIVFYRPSVLVAKRVKQSFRDGIDTHCVLDAMEDSINRRIESQKNKYDKNKSTKLLGVLKGYREEYDSGVPEDKMEMVAVASGFKINVYDILVFFVIFFMYKRSTSDL
jgi:hypothetical protein